MMFPKAWSVLSSSVLSWWLHLESLLLKQSWETGSYLASSWSLTADVLFVYPKAFWEYSISQKTISWKWSLPHTITEKTGLPRVLRSAVAKHRVLQGGALWHPPAFPPFCRLIMGSTEGPKLVSASH